MPHIIIASKNPVKMNAALIAFQKMFPETLFEVEGVSVQSGVKDQPMSDAETFEGATNRVNNAAKEKPDADYWVGIEGGIEEKNGEMEVFAWTIIKSRSGKYGKGRTATFFLPPQICELIREGVELGKADDIVFGRENSKQGNGAVGILTGDVITRTDYYVESTALALIPFKNPKLY